MRVAQPKQVGDKKGLNFQVLPGYIYSGYHACLQLTCNNNVTGNICKLIGMDVWDLIQNLIMALASFLRDTRWESTDVSVIKWRERSQQQNAENTFKVTQRLSLLPKQPKLPLREECLCSVFLSPP